MKRNLKIGDTLWRFGLVGTCLMIGAFGSATSARGEGPSIELELNRLETVGDACRAYIMLENRSAELTSFRLDLFALDTSGVVAQRLTVQLGPVPEDKTIIKVFDFPGVTCEGVGSVLLNDILTCETEDGPSGRCVGRVAVGTKSVPFLK